MRLIFFICLFAAVTHLDVAGQSKKKSKPSGPPAAGYSNLPTSLAPGTTTQAAAPKKQSKSKGSKQSGKVTYDQQREYYERVEAVAKAREKEARIMEKPQYSNPMYFGHKRPPKKRPPGKMKFCKECGIRH